MGRSSPRPAARNVSSENHADPQVTHRTGGSPGTAAVTVAPRQRKQGLDDGTSERGASVEVIARRFARPVPRGRQARSPPGANDQK